jgi:type I restriction enzyme S subunit
MKLQRLGNVIKIISGSPFDSSFFNDNKEGVPLIRVRDVNSGFAGIYYSGKYEDAFIINDGDLLIGLDGDFKCVEWKYGKALLNQRVCKLIPIEGLVSREYILHFLPQTLNEIHRNTNFTTVKHLSTKTINEIKIPLPSLSDQIRIAEILSQAESLITLRKKSISLLDELLKSTFLEMFGDESKFSGKEFSLNELKAGGNETFSNGPFGSDLLTSELQEEGVPVIYIRDIRNGYFFWKSNVYVTERKANYLKNCQVQSGDILIAKVGDPPGISAVYPDKSPLAIITQDVIRYRVNTKIVSPTYLSFYINSEKGKSIIKKISVEGTRNRFPLGDLKKTTIKIPLLELQIKFVAIVEKVEALKTQYQQSLAELQNMHGVLSQKAFKGELNIKEQKVERI